MTFIRDLVALFQSRNISVEVDQLLLPLINSEDKVTTPRIISFNLYKLIYHIGTIQSRRFATSNRLKFFDKTDLIENIFGDTNEFKVKIDEIRQVNGSETLASISEDFGIGISVVIAESLFRIKGSTIQKIYGTGRRPDWKCQLSDDRILVVEGKGAITVETSNSQETKALAQKIKEPGDIRAASLTLIKEHEISTARFLDPPTENGNSSPIMENHILRAGHYASVFSFLGNSKLSMYYSQMRKRLEGRITPFEQDLKDQTFRDLRLNEPTIQFMNADFAGSFYRVEDEKYVFVGIDKRLLSYQGFIDYNEFENDVDEDIEGNHYILYNEGVLLIEINNVEYFSHIIGSDEIPNYQDNITISDIDEMNEISFSKYFLFILKRNNFTDIAVESVLWNDLRVDLKATLNNLDYYFEFKISRNKRLLETDIQRLNLYINRIGDEKLVLVTNAKFDRNSKEQNFIVIDRSKLVEIAHDSRLLVPILNLQQ